jgi:hypothetical protein
VPGLFRFGTPLDTPEKPRAWHETGSTYIYATTLERGRNRFALGLPRLTPPRRGAGWEVCGISYLAEGLLVSWRCPARLLDAERGGSE